MSEEATQKAGAVPFTHARIQTPAEIQDVVTELHRVTAWLKVATRPKNPAHACWFCGCHYGAQHWVCDGEITLMCGEHSAIVKAARKLRECGAPELARELDQAVGIGSEHYTPALPEKAAPAAKGKRP